MATLTHILKPDAQAILLLCASFGQTRQAEPIPLNLGEYNLLARKLQQEGLRPGDLLASDRKSLILSASGEDLNSQRILQLLERGAMLAIAVEDWTNKGLWILSRSDEAYPQRLKRKLKQQSPPILYGVGNQDLLARGGLAIVGSRNIDDDGLSYTKRIAEKCAEQGIQVISGGARGVDQTAMLSAISAGGTSVGVLADSLMKAAVSLKYRQGLCEGRVALISPYDPAAGFNVGNAMNRNKHVYGLADRVLVVDSSYQKGGTWAGAKEELKREIRIPVWVRVDRKKLPGNQGLIELGAFPFPAEPWNRDILTMVAESEQLSRSQSPARVAKQLSLNDLEIIEEKSNATLDRQNKESKIKLPKDAYEAILPLLLYHLTQPREDNEVAVLLDVAIGQTRSWLKKAVAEKLVKKTKNVYVSLEGEEQLKLLSLN
ncbi:DNA-processing protein DprA [Oscillatoria sp. FACHB-1406]|uniref:DNA-processing protein DprA n=1 Tax=Oscillatoria sp. FACHB-1406 TaxID=2692846 RepID=UPI00168312B6|nr:DNA-processing protein DprA [Oscillatoria sp. FACHB-1406]MBD2580090.1 DNA-protecting protein DprA [Oscillatoria sp. FACHB-1406]